MLETVKFPVGRCPSCGPNVLLAGEINAQGELIRVCIHCGLTPSDPGIRELAARSLKLHGYVVDGEIESRGCGDDSGGGCAGSCSK